MSANADYSDSAAQGTVDNDYASRTGQSEIPVQRDDAPVEQGVNKFDADSDEQLAADDQDAIDKSNIVDERTRGAAPQKGAYTEPGDEEGLPSDTGRSSNY
ncbi:hypothetical protein K461DRAFT_283431 [Myriangium duriaei CBS 260.36]|uniref:Histone chaperone domain-containing protein n=1 Tax=Myriangium duriaei CBS 260.36 TaxID=1168546 RepID=A0A9P4MBQ6_9PEZI|nr:hypothetical protein K461DRAFT_283431 [Myriangium duriaei CBS 260.36]